MKDVTLSAFTNLYPVQKTLRFELRPIGKTAEWIEQKGLLAEDEHRAQSYKKVKKLIDAYHKYYIDESLNQWTESDLKTFHELLEKYRELMKKSDASLKKKTEEISLKLRKNIACHFDTNQLKPEKLIKDDLLNFLYECEQNGEVIPCDMTIEECKSVIEEFKDFSTYFEGFRLNRENMYSDEGKSTAISYRLIHDNLPKFIGNMESWIRVKETLKDSLPQWRTDMTSHFGEQDWDSLFENLSSYSQCITQAGITIYNTLIGGLSEGEVKVKGLNEYINLYNQTCKEKKNRLPKMTELFKMILSDRGTISWLPEQFENDSELLTAVNQAYHNIHDNVFEDNKENISLKTLMMNLDDYDLGGIYVKNDTTLTFVLKQACGEWNVLTKAMESEYEKIHPIKKKQDFEKYEESKSKWIKSFDSFSLSTICHYVGDDNIVRWYQNLWSKENDETTLFQEAESAYKEAEVLLNTEYRGNLRNDSASIEKIKVLLDLLKNIQRLATSLKGDGDESGRDGRFYAEWDRLTAILDQLTPLYNMVRNYVTQKAYSEEKFKLNFENSTLLGGWDQNKETANTAILFRKGELFFLGIMDKKNNHSFASDTLPSKGSCYEKVDYKLLPGANKMLPKVFFSNKNIAYYAPSNELLNNYKNGTHKKGEQFNLDHCHQLIDFFKASINKNSDWSKFNFKFSDTETYDDISGFYREVEQQGYKLSFRPVAESYINRLIDEGKLFFFQIYNKDFSSFSKGTPNMHTLYWRALFSEENLKNVVYKLNGEAEVFYRKKSITYDEKHQQEGFHYEMLKDKFSYPIYKDRRYSVDKFQFHVPITMNFKSTGRDYIDQQVREFAKAGGVKHIIGIDRGERHLLYLSMIDLKGRIIKQSTLNEIVNEYKGQHHTTDYHALLDLKENDRLKARQNWQTIEGIKDLKEGYLSQVVHIISQLMVDYQAIVVLEDLNFGFMRGRQKVEKQVYQKFEKMLIDKLNYLVDKKKPIGETGGVLHALQLTSKFESFQKMGKQSGFLFYVPASLTSKIDPVTGFSNYINNKYENLVQARELVGKFADIRHNAEKDYFEFVIEDYMHFNPKAKGRQSWVLCSYGNRIHTFRNPDKNNEWDNEEINLTQKFKQLFESHHIDYQQNLMAQILLNEEVPFYRSLLANIGLMLQMRNSITNTKTDYIISPVADEKGHFYCSNDGIESLPKDADANGAYNIARKGLWAVLQMQQATDPTDVKLAMSNDEWMRFAQEKPYLD